MNLSIGYSICQKKTNTENKKFFVRKQNQSSKNHQSIFETNSSFLSVHFEKALQKADGRKARLTKETKFREHKFHFYF